MIDVKNPVNVEVKPSHVSSESYTRGAAATVSNLKTPTIEKQSRQSANSNNVSKEKTQKPAEQVTAQSTAEKERMEQ